MCYYNKRIFEGGNFMTSNRIDFKTITTREDLKTITEEELQVIKKSSTYHSNYLRHTYRDNSNTLLEILKTSNLHGWKKREIKKQILRIS